MLSFFQIIKKVSEACDVSITEIQGRGRQESVAWARHLLVYFLRKINKISYPAIGKIIKRDHTTIINSYKKVTKKIETDEKFKFFVEQLIDFFVEEGGIFEKDSNNITRQEIEYLQTTILPKQKVNRDGGLQTSDDALRKIKNLEITEREETILKKYRTGMTLEEIGKCESITRERVRQIVMHVLIKEIGQKAKDGLKIDIKEYIKSQKVLHLINSHNISEEEKIKISSDIDSGFSINEIIKKYKITKTFFKKLFPYYKKEDIVETHHKKKRWSRAYERCRDCKTTQVPHMRRGFCERCFGSLRSKQREEFISKYNNKCMRCNISRDEAKNKYKKDFYLTKELAGIPFAPLCRKCFLELSGANMVRKRY